MSTGSKKGVRILKPAANRVTSLTESSSYLVHSRGQLSNTYFFCFALESNMEASKQRSSLHRPSCISNLPAVFQLYFPLTFNRSKKNPPVVIAVIGVSCGILAFRQHSLQTIVVILNAMSTMATVPVVFEDGSHIPVHIQKPKQKLEATFHNGKFSPHCLIVVFTLNQSDRFPI